MQTFSKNKKCDVDVVGFLADKQQVCMFLYDNVGYKEYCFEDGDVISFVDHSDAAGYCVSSLLFSVQMFVSFFTRKDMTKKHSESQ